MQLNLMGQSEGACGQDSGTGGKLAGRWLESAEKLILNIDKF